MATQAEIENLISKALDGQYIVLKKSDSTTDFKTHIGNVTEGLMKHVPFEKWHEDWPNEPEEKKETIVYYTDGTSKEFDIVGELVWNSIITDRSSKFTGNSIVTRIDIGAHVTSIGEYAFYCFQNLSILNLNDNITSIGEYAFGGCAITSIIIPDKVQRICRGLFEYSYNLKTIILGDNINSIEDGAFSRGYSGYDFYNYSLNIYTTSQNVANLITEKKIYSNYYIASHYVYVYINDVLYKTLYHAASCFPVGTKITLADGSKKNVEDIVYSDILKVFDFDEGKDGSAPICWLTKKGLKNDHFYRLTFSDGTVLRTTGTNSNHKVYNVDERYFKGVDKTEIGDRIWSENGIVTVTNKEYIEEEVEYYNIITSKKINCYADGILTSDRYGNLYPIDENMKYVKEGRETRPYSPEFEEAGVTEYWYENLRLGESTDDMDTIKNYIAKCEGQMRPLDE